LPASSAEDFLQDSFAGWGEAQNPHSSPAYVEVAAIPSATLSVKRGEEIVGAVRWGALRDKQSVETDSLRVEIVEDGRNWVETVIVDDATRQPVPCRVHFRSPQGVPYQPHGH